MTGPAQAEDKAALRRLYQQNNGPAWPFEPEPKQESQTFVAKRRGQVVGLASVSLVDYGARSRATIHELEVTPEASLDAIGRSLLEACLSWLTEHGVPRVYVHPEDERSYGFYRQAGFEEGWGCLYKIVPVQAAHQTWA